MGIRAEVVGEVIVEDERGKNRESRGGRLDSGLRRFTWFGYCDRDREPRARAVVLSCPNVTVPMVSTPDTTPVPEFDENPGELRLSRTHKPRRHVVPICPPGCRRRSRKDAIV